jgi:Kef-type K+ transport system membrane component KefB
MITPDLMVRLMVILAAAWVAGTVFTRLGLPAMLGQMLAGLLLGPAVFGLITASGPLELMADFGIFFVMFYAGMEMDPKLLLRHIRPSMGVALGGFVLPFGLGFVTSLAFGGTPVQSLFVGLGISITAIAVQSVVLQSLRINKSEIGHIIIGAAIVDDILSLIGLSVLLGLARSGGLDWMEVVLILVKVGLFFVLTILIGRFVMPRLTRRLTDQEAKGFTFAIGVALAMAYLAELAGLHLIIGAFLAGQFVREEIMDQKVYEAIANRFYGIAYGFLVPIFFVSLSFHLRLSLDWRFLLFSLVLIAAAVAGKLIGAGLPLRLFGHNRWESIVVGFGMNGRGAVELVVASVVIGLSDRLFLQEASPATFWGAVHSPAFREPLLTGDQFSALVLMAFVTTLIAPISLKWAVGRSCSAEEHAGFCHLLETSTRT